VKASDDNDDLKKPAKTANGSEAPEVIVESNGTRPPSHGVGEPSSSGGIASLPGGVSE